VTDADPTPTSPGAEGLDHLQRAAREMLAAARSFLDAIEQVVEDREALKEVSTTVTGLAATVGDALGEAVRGGRPAWVDAAWTPDGGRPGEPIVDEPVEDRPGDDGPGGDGSVRRTTTGDGDDTGDRDDTDDGDDTEDWARPLVDPDAPRRPSRVRRIAVD
jgi:hypothetical protein